MNEKDLLKTKLHVLIIFRDFLLRDLILMILSKLDAIAEVHTCQIQSYTRDVVLQHRPNVVIADRLPSNLMMELFEAGTMNGERIRVVTVSLAQEDLYVIEVEGHHKVEIQDFVDAVLGTHQHSVGPRRHDTR